MLKAAAAVSFAAVRGTAANSAPTVGLIGCGGRGGTVTKALVENTPARVVAMCDLFDEQIERAKKRTGVENPQTYKDLHKLLESDVDAVIIATPVFLHADHFEAAVKAGKHIYIEKPAAADVEGCKRIMRAADPDAERPLAGGPDGSALERRRSRRRNPQRAGASRNTGRVRCGAGDGHSQRAVPHRNPLAGHPRGRHGPGRSAGCSHEARQWGAGRACRDHERTGGDRQALTLRALHAPRRTRDLC
jgi:hypothetical protein